MVVVIIGREFAVSGLRHVAQQRGIIIAANWWGKLKTLSQIVAISLLIVTYQLGRWSLTSKIALWVALFMTVISLVSYFSGFWRRVVGTGK
jgi:CDP-diacylglycerol--glycerol-3-phosphate 3-phosphatidyltransferase